MKLLTNNFKDLVINQQEVNRLLKYIDVTEHQFLYFVEKVFNSDKTFEEEFETKEFLLTGDFITGDQFKSTKNILSISVFPKALLNDKIYQRYANIQFKAEFFEFDDPIYKKLSKEIEIEEVDYPYVYISKIFSESSYLIFEDLSGLKAPFNWIENTGYPNLFNDGEELKDLALLNFGN